MINEIYIDNSIFDHFLIDEVSNLKANYMSYQNQERKFHGESAIK